MSGSFASRVEAVLLVLALAWLGASEARACDAVIISTAPTLVFDYDPFAFAKTVARASFEIDSRETKACEADLVLLDAQHLVVAEKDIDGTGVTVTFTATASDAAAIATATPGMWRVRIEPGRRITVSIDGLVAQDAVATAGLHTAELSLELRDVGMPTSRAPPTSLRLALNAKPRAQMNIAGAAGTFGTGANVSRVDFGTIESNASRRVFLQIRANTRARLTIDSANQGRLLRTTGPADDGGIAYRAQFDDKDIDLSRHWEGVIDPPHSIAGKSFPLDLKLGAVGAHAAGDYNDVLTLELSAL
uniref:hypothetical protein n=1 Tax=uncultured Sphingomonas sp. TaxID=158754 RepID=UPI0035CB0561